MEVLGFLSEIPDPKNGQHGMERSLAQRIKQRAEVGRVAEPGGREE